MGSDGEVVPWRSELGAVAQGFRENAAVRTGVENSLAILRAIDAGELLSALPECAVARSQHMTALALLRLAEEELAAVQAVVRR
jgi:hypothetical protein